MRREIRERLRNENDVFMVESKIMDVDVDRSIIQQLGCLMDEEDDKKILFSRNGFGKNYEHLPLTRCGKGLGSNSKMHRRKNEKGEEQSSRKMQYQENMDRTRNVLKQQNSSHSSPNRNDPIFKIKYDFSKSWIIKMKDFILEELVERCRQCGGPRSGVVEGRQVCRKGKCGELCEIENRGGFGLIQLLYEIENPSCSQQSMNGMIERLDGLLLKMERQKGEILEMKMNMEGILERRDMFNKGFKGYFRDFMKCLPYGFNKGRDLGGVVEEIKQKFLRVDLGCPYGEMILWRKLSEGLFLWDREMKNIVEKNLPLNLRNDYNNLGEEISILSDNFRGRGVQLKVSNTLGYNFNGILESLKILVDGSCQIIRDNLLMVEKVERLQIIFESRRTNRQLIELFNILPICVSLFLNFDYKLHSHVSSEIFPFLGWACQLAEDELVVRLENCRLEIFEDILFLSKRIRQKNVLRLEIGLNDFLSENEFPEEVGDEQWGNGVVKEIIRRIGNKVQKIYLDLPFVYNRQEICEFILNENYGMLCDLRLKSRGCQGEGFRMSNLLGEIMNRKKVLFGMLAVEKREKKGNWDVFKKFPEIRSSVFEVLF